MKWVTWEHVGIDRIGSAWLIRRFVDPDAEFVFILRDAMLPSHAEPYDIPGARLAHHHGRSSFHTILDEYDLQDPVLRRLARVVDEADTIQEVALEPAAPGLDLICRGIRRTSRDDWTALAKKAGDCCGG